MQTQADIAIVGGGIIGLTCAYFLAGESLTVEVVERGELGREASWAGAGIIPPGNPETAASPIDRLRAIGSAGFGRFSDELRELTGIENGYHRSGGIEFLTDDDDEILSRWTDEGVAFERLPREPAPPHSANLGTAYHLPDYAQVRNPWHLRALVAACERRGVRIRASIGNCRLACNRVGGRIEGIELLDGTRLRAGRYLLAAGAWTSAILESEQLGRSLIHPVRGQIVLMNTGKPDRQPILMMGKRYLVSRHDGHVLVGSTEEPEAGFEKGNTPEAVADLIAFAGRLNPELAGARIEKCWSGLRPGTIDGLPFIGPVDGWENLFIAGGHFRAGVQLSIGTARLVTELVTGRPTCVPPDAFRIDRPPAAPRTPTFRS